MLAYSVVMLAMQTVHCNVYCYLSKKYIIQFVFTLHITSSNKLKKH